MSNAECYERMLAGDDFYNKSDIINTKTTKSKMNNKTCKSCLKADVCMYKDEVDKAKKGVDDIINSISTNIFEISITCKKWCSNINIRKEVSEDRDGGIR